MEATQPGKLATYEEAWKHLGLSRSTFYRLIDDKEFGDVIYLSAKMPRIEWVAIHDYVERKKNETK